MNLRIACQTYTWEMLGGDWNGTLADILSEISQAGYEGIEISTNVLGGLVDRPREVRSMLESHGLELAAVAFSRPSGFTREEAASDDLAYADRVIHFLSHFPGARLAMGGASHPSRDGARAKRERAYAIYREIGRAAAARSIPSNVHPHSHHGSLIESREEYEELLGALQGSPVTLGPDSGHIVRGGQNLIEAISAFASHISHIHFKDVSDFGHDGKWVPLGEGVCDFEGALRILVDRGYRGWIVSEEESDEARAPSRRGFLLRRNLERLRKIVEKLG